MNRLLARAPAALALALSFFFSSPNYSQTLDFEKQKVRKEGAVLCAEIAAPPINLLGPETTDLATRDALVALGACLRRASSR